MKKSIKIVAAAVLAAMMLVSLVSCGKSEGEEKSNVPANKVFSADDLWGKKIGTQLGTTGMIYAEDYENEELAKEAGQSGNLATVERYTKGADAVLALKQGKIDCVIIDDEPAKAFVENNKDLKILEEPFAVEDYAMCLKKGNTELLEKINGALATLKENGTIDKILSNYIGDDTKGKTPYVSPEGVTRDNGTLTMATNATFKPYEYVDSDGKVIGIDVDICQAVCDLLGYELKVEDMKFDAIISAVQSGKADVGVAGMTVTEDRMKSVDFTSSYATGTQVIIVRAK